ncbi:MAG: hypothetical protein FVQ84_09225 [Planctomycetes bacterium]|nr:hypothetical protein [Planctomycetota bacterium]
MTEKAEVPALPKIQIMIEKAAKDYPKLMYLVSPTEESEQVETDPKPLYRPGLLAGREWETDSDIGYNRHYLFRDKDTFDKAGDYFWKKGKTKDKAWDKLCMIAKRMIEPIIYNYQIRKELEAEFFIDESPLYEDKDCLNIIDEAAARRWLNILINLRELRKPRIEQHLQLSGMIDVFAETVKAYDQLFEIVSPAYGKVGEKPKFSAEDKAIAELRKNPSWTNKQIAEKVGIHEKTLYKCTDFMKVRAILKEQGKRERTEKTTKGYRDKETGWIEPNK